MAEVSRYPSRSRAIEPVLDQVVAELTAAHPDRRIETSFEVETPVFCDPARIAQLFSNLLGNAISHGAPDQPVRVEATAKAEMFELSVANGGAAIPEEARTRLFQPFYRGKAHGPSQGLGLGLYIASEIAKAHGGSIEVELDRQRNQVHVSNAHRRRWIAPAAFRSLRPAA